MTIRFALSERRDPRLGRNLHHDSRSLAYPFLTTAPVLKSVRHERHAPIFDQGQLGSCTGNAGLGCLGTGPFWERLGPRLQWDENAAVALYSYATQLDTFTGTYPPDDTGSDGLSVAKAAKNYGWISGYRHVLNGSQGLAGALQETPVIIGIPWYDSMFTPDSDGYVDVASGSTVAGGHELVVDGYDALTGDFSVANSWGTSWGHDGWCKVTSLTMNRLLQEDGDATVFTPIGQAPPEPITDPALARLLAKESHWLKNQFPAFGASSAQRELNRYLKAIGAI